MGLSITAARKATAEEWGHIWNACDYATYFHSFEWAEIWQKYTRGKLRPDAKLITFSDGKVVLLPFSSQLRLRGLVKKYISSPAGTFGGWLSLDELTENHADLLLEYILEHYKNLAWRMNPYNSSESSMNVQNVIDDVTHALSLEPDFEVIYKGWTKGHASAVRKARKVGVEIREAVTLQDWEDYYNVYEDSLERWGESASSRYEWLLFQNMFDLSPPNIKLWLAIFEGKIISGALCFYSKKHVVYWHGAALSKYFNLRPVNLLIYEVVKCACEGGYQWFDFNPSGGHEGVRAFKKSFGAKAMKSPVVSLVSPSLKHMLVDQWKVFSVSRGITRK